MNPLLRALVAAGLLDQATADRMSRAMSPAEAQAYAEQRMAALWSAGLQGQLSRLLEVIRTNDYGFPPSVMESFWRREDRVLYESVIPGLRDVAQEAAITAAVRGGGFTMWNAVNESVINWVEDYYISADAALVGSIPNLNQTGRTIVGNAFNAWQRGELEVATNAEGLPRLIAALEPAFGPERASRIAITENSRIMAESELAAARENEFVEWLEWATAADEIAARCPICGPMHGRRVRKDSNGFPTAAGVLYPPAHPNCRCQILSLTDAVARIPTGIGGAGGWNPEQPNRKQPVSRGQRGNNNRR